MGNSDKRLDPDALLKLIDSDTKNQSSGQLRVFLGMSAGVGKTYAMLKAAHQKINEGVDVVIGVVETHGRSETAALIDGLPLIPRKKIDYRGTQLEEMDLETILEKRPQLVIVDELAHTNAPGTRHPKRYQDVLELLDAGIDVYTALNVQHLESRKDAVEQITGISIRETVPDSILERATLVELVDIAPSELLKRLKGGKVYLGEKAEAAAQNFFKEDRLTALREIALRMTAERVDQDLQKLSVTKDESPWQTNERLLVAISHSPHSEKLIRATRRLAYNLEAPWVVVHVDTGLTLNEEDEAQLVKNIQLARELNAEVISTTDGDIASAIKRICRQKNVTQVIVGRSTRSWFRNVIEGGSLLEKLVQESQEVDVHVIRQDNLALQRPSLISELNMYRSKTGLFKYYYAFWFLVAVTAIGAVFEPYIGYRAVGFIFLLAVISASLWGSIGAVLFTAGLSALIWNFGFIPPRFTLNISSADDLILCISYFVVAMITGFLTNRIRIKEQLIRRREERTNLINQILQDIASSQNKSEFITKVCDRTSLYMDGQVSVILKDITGALKFDKVGSQNILNEKEEAVAQWAYQNQKIAGWSTETLSQAQSMYLPLAGVNEVVGVLVFRPNKKIKKLSVDQQDLIFSIVTQLGISIERHFLSRRLIQVQRLKDSEVLHETLLNSISHEIRTPLTTVMSNSSALEVYAKTDPRLVPISDSLNDAGDRLNRVIENLLDMSRLNSGVVSLKLEWHDLSDLIGVVLKKLEKNLQGHEVKVDIPESISFLHLDFRLFEHALSNIILNASQYAGEDCKISISAKMKMPHVIINICDDGMGIPESSKALVFEKFYRLPGAVTGGTGLGLSIVKGIVELHGGIIQCEDNHPHGVCFSIQLPYKQMPKVEMKEDL